MKFKYHDQVKLLNDEFYRNAIFAVVDYFRVLDGLVKYEIVIDGTHMLNIDEENLELAYPET